MLEATSSGRHLRARVRIVVVSAPILIAAAILMTSGVPAEVILPAVAIMTFVGALLSMLGEPPQEVRRAQVVDLSVTPTAPSRGAPSSMAEHGRLREHAVVAAFCTRQETVDLLTRLLTSSAIEVIAAPADSDSVMEILRRQHVDAVFLDDRCADAIVHIRADEKLALVYALLMTDVPSIDVKINALMSGFDDVLDAAVNNVELAAKLIAARQTIEIPYKKQAVSPAAPPYISPDESVVEPDSSRASRTSQAESEFLPLKANTNGDDSGVDPDSSGNQ